MQPMFFPWIGLFEQVRMADVYVHFDDVQLPQGRSFTNRVQIKTSQGIRWLTGPLKKVGKVPLKDALIDHSQHWKDKHLRTLNMNYSKAPYFHDMMRVVEEVYRNPTQSISELNQFCIEHISE